MINHDWPDIYIDPMRWPGEEDEPYHAPSPAPASYAPSPEPVYAQSSGYG